MGCSSSSPAGAKGRTHGWELKGALRDGTEVWELFVKLRHVPLEGDGPSRVRVTKFGDEDLVAFTEVENSFLQRQLLALGHRRPGEEYDVQVGDIILEVNGRISTKGILEELSASHLHMLLQRRVARQPKPTSMDTPETSVGTSLRRGETASSLRRCSSSSTTSLSL